MEPSGQRCVCKSERSLCVQEQKSVLTRKNECGHKGPDRDVPGGYLRTSSTLRLPQDKGLYSFANEHDACGVGMVATLTNQPDHRIIENGLTVLRRLMHRGAAGGDPETGDGAGILFAIPDAFFRDVLPIPLPPAGQYAVAMIFGGEQDEQRIEAVVRREGGRVLYWRDVPTAPQFIGKSAQTSCPKIRQLFVAGEDFADQAAFERKLFVMRRVIEKEVADCYLPSFSSRSIVYKGLLLATQLDRFYPDLSHPLLASPLAVVHQRYSTNTFPTWQLAHPFRYLAHNGEINTLRGNLNQLRSREPFLVSDLFGDDLKKLLPLIDDRQNDSACLDNMLELLVAAGRSLPHAMLMLMPGAWGKKYHLGSDVRGFFDYHSAQMEPWDGPAAVAFSDGVNLGAMLDRNGLRPARYTITDDGLFVLASETGVLDMDPKKIVRKGRLRPGEIIWCDLTNHRVVYDAEIKNRIARQKPYRRWSQENKIVVNGLFDSVVPERVCPNLIGRQRRFGWTAEDLEMILEPMAETGHEPIGSMGNDAALAVLSDKPQLLFNYFKQHFAQVTNPPIDPIREELVMSLTTYIGNSGNILDDAAQCAHLIKLPRPVLTGEDLARLSADSVPLKKAVLPLAWHDYGSPLDLKTALDDLQDRAVELVNDDCKILILSDRDLDEDCLPIPSLLATAAVNRRLTDVGKRPSVGLIVQSGEVREIMHYAILLGYGATAIHPWLALESIAALVDNKEIPLDSVTATENYIKAVDMGLLKVMSKMGISTLRSYRGAQIFEAVGLDSSVIEHYFKGTTSNVGGIKLTEIAQEVKSRRIAMSEPANMLPMAGQYKYRRTGEHHLWTPETLNLFRQAVQNNDMQLYRQYASRINEQANHLCTLRGLFEFKKTEPVPIEDVESVDSIVRHFVSGAMSLGSLSPEAHEAIAIAMNRLGARSNCGEGGEDPYRNTPNEKGEVRASAIRQIASGRFGVTIDYLAGAKELQIKMAQGAKPGEGGQLPGRKVDEHIARVRHSTPGVTLISPPPHHDIYSIEDLAQLIYDLRASNREARISVKLVSESGVGTVAAGVAKAHADVILISGHDGGTGAAPLTSIKHAGMPWELGLAETHQTLVLNRLRDRVRLQVDGQIKTGRDVVIAALLGAEEFGFATTLLVCLGCVMLRRCHDNCCPVGITTQDPELRKCFHGKPESIENFLRLLAQEVREYLASLGLRSLDEAVGRSDLLQKNRAIDFYKTRHLDFSKIFEYVPGDAVRFAQPYLAEQTFDETVLIPKVATALAAGKACDVACTLQSVDRAVGTVLSSQLVRRYGPEGLPPETILAHFTGTAGQSFGAFLARGLLLELEGEANDYVGKGLSGGIIVVKPSRDTSYKPNENVIVGNVTGYGGTSGKMFFCGQAGERFAIRNSGFDAVVEGVGDHGCEYMTGGRVVILGPTGVNFAAGMTGGTAWVYDVANDFDLKCNVDTVDLASVVCGSQEESELLTLIQEHVNRTGSAFAKDILDRWEDCRGCFVQVIPIK
ncbi:MAG: glutamate synthase large subunit [Planctomycetia bacterium]|nr:glutamate synthase large subunit [Planctomycetia bacterium]